tara:strand:- start:3253 stop:4023 length:771 start_codon:yes stop_codon:yes gene_type:complete
METTTNARSLRALDPRARGLARRRVDERAVVVARRARASIAPSTTSAASSSHSHHSSWASRDADVVAWARDAWAVSLERDDDVIDATLGRGRDALACAKMCPEGVVYGFDVEPDAVASATMAFERAGIDAERARFEERCHADALEEMARTRPRAFGAVTFNLGYLPGDEDAKTRAKRRRTNAKTTLRAVSAALECARVGGVVTVVAYLKHEGGAEEHEAVREALRASPTKSWTVTERRVLNRNAAPVLYVARRAAE